MALHELIRAVDELSSEDFEALYIHIHEQREYRQHSGSVDRHNDPIDMHDLRQILAELREGFSESDLDELKWAMNVEYVDRAG